MNTTEQAEFMQHVMADKSIMKYIKNENYYTVERFIEDAISYIESIKTGRMLCIIKSVSSSGMSRVVKFNSAEKGSDDRFYYRQYTCFFLACGYKESRSNDGGFNISGCGMDMVFHTNYSIIHKLTRLGFLEKSECKKLAQMTPTIL